MPIKVRCKSCSHQFETPRRQGRVQTECPECGSAIKIPERRSSPVSESDLRSGATYSRRVHKKKGKSEKPATTATESESAWYTSPVVFGIMGVLVLAGAFGLYSLLIAPLFERVQKQAIYSAMPAKVEKLGSTVPEIVEVSKQSLRSHGTDAAVALAQGIQSPRGPIRVASLQLFEELGADGIVALDELLKGLESDQMYTRADSAKAIASIGSDADAAAPKLKQLLDDPAIQVRVAAMKAYASVSSPKATLEAILKLLADPNVEVQVMAINITGDQGADAESVIPELLRQLSEATRFSKTLVEVAVCRALSKTGANSPEVIEALAAHLEQPNRPPASLEAAMATLGKCGPKALPHIETALENKTVMAYAVRALADQGEAARPLIPRIVAAIPRMKMYEKEARLEVFRASLQTKVITRTEANARGEVLSQSRYVDPTGGGEPDDDPKVMLWRNGIAAARETLEKLGVVGDDQLVGLEEEIVNE